MFAGASYGANPQQLTPPQAVTADGRVHSFGSCGDGKLGNGTKVGKQLTPGAIPLCLLRTAASSRTGGGAEEGSSSRKQERTAGSCGGGDGC